MKNIKGSTWRNIGLVVAVMVIIGAIVFAVMPWSKMEAIGYYNENVEPFMTDEHLNDVMSQGYAEFTELRDQLDKCDEITDITLEGTKECPNLHELSVNVYESIYHKLFQRYEAINPQIMQFIFMEWTETQDDLQGTLADTLNQISRLIPAENANRITVLDIANCSLLDPELLAEARDSGDNTENTTNNESSDSSENTANNSENTTDEGATNNSNNGDDTEATVPQAVPEKLTISALAKTCASSGNEQFNAQPDGITTQMQAAFAEFAQYATTLTDDSDLAEFNTHYASLYKAFITYYTESYELVKGNIDTTQGLIDNLQSQMNAIK